MDDPLQRLHTLGLEEGKQYLQQHCMEGEQSVAASAWLEQEALDRLYAPFTSLKLAELLMFLGEQIHNPISYALGLKARGDALVQIGHYKAAMISLDEAGALFLQQQDERNWARSRISWMVASAWLGDVEAALREAERARAVFSRLGEPSWVCTIDNNIAVIYGQAGRYQEALALYERMRATYLTLTEQDSASVSRNIALIDLNQALTLPWLGDFEHAYFLQRRARDRLRELGEANLVLITEIHIADLDYLQGYYGSALRRYYHA
ncbi:MAG: tetratricopeptide repeat protein, partial [Chloroflexi bacterium]